MIAMPVIAPHSQPSDTFDNFTLPSHRFAVWTIIVFVIGIIGVCILLVRLHYDAIQDMAHRNLHNFVLLQDQFNHKLMTDLDAVITVLADDLQKPELDDDAFFHNYYALINDHSILQTLLVLDSEGIAIFDSRPEQPVVGNNFADAVFYSVHIDERLNQLVITPPIQSPVDNHWTVPISRAIWDDNGNLVHVIVVSASPLVWSESLNELNSSGEYRGILTRDDGVVLTTFPYRDALIGTQLAESQFLSTIDHHSNMDISSSFIDGEPTLLQMHLMESVSATLIIETLNIDELVQVDQVVLIIIVIAGTILFCGISILILYLRQHRALQLQADSLHQLNRRLQHDI